MGQPDELAGYTLVKTVFAWAKYATEWEIIQLREGMEIFQRVDKHFVALVTVI